jgi:hypothetical protein
MTHKNGYNGNEVAEFLNALDGKPLIAEQLRAAIDEPGCKSPLRGCHWWLQAGKLRSRPRCKQTGDII